MTLVEQIYKQGHKMNSFPFKLYHLDTKGENQIIISIPKRLFKRAVKRNLLRRRTREAIRALRSEYPVISQKDILLDYISPNILEYGEIKQGLANTFGKIPQVAQENA